MRIISFLFLILFSVACSDDGEESIGFYVSSGNERIDVFSATVGENWLRAGGGSGVYLVSSSNADIVDAEISKDVITLKAYQLGEVNITLKDDRDEQVTIRVTVAPKIMVLEVVEVFPYIHYIDDEGDTDAGKEVEKDIIENMDISKGWRLELERESWDGRNECEGRLIVYPNDIKKRMEGTYKLGAKRESALILEYEDRVHHFKAPEISNKGKSRDTGPLRLTLVEDHTRMYQELYPNANFSRVECVVQLNKWGSL